MNKNKMRSWRPILFTALAMSSAICLTVPLHADVSSLSQSVQGAESDVKGSIQDVNSHALSVFKELGIAEVASSMEKSGGTQTLSGKKGDITVEITLDSTGKNQTHVGIIAKRGTFNWNKDYANSLLDKIVEKS